MKLRGAAKVHYDAGPNMTPLVDVVMVILIFLMLTGTFAVGEHFLKQSTPISEKGAGGVATPGLPPDEPLEIIVDSTSSEEWIAKAGQIAIRNNRASLTAQLTKMRELMNSNNTPTDKIQVVINPGATTKWKHLVEVFESALDAKFEKVAFSSAH